MFARKKLSFLTLGAVLASATMMPAIYTQAATPTITTVVLEQNGQVVEITKEYFNAGISAQIIKASDIKYFKLDSKYYSKANLNAYLGLGKTITETFTILVSSPDKVENITPVAGTIQNGKVVTTQTGTDATNFEVIDIY